jgi:hypothetical protein
VGDVERGPTRARELAVVTCAALATSALVLVSTRHGIGANGTDSVAYLTMADDVAAGRMPYPTVIGVPPTHLPPGWSIVTGSLVAVTPASALDVARAVNVALAGLLPVAVFLAVRARAARPSWIPALMAVVVASSYPLFELASRAVVEPLFLVLLVASLAAIERVARDRSWSATLVAAVLVSALVLTRLVGVAALLPLALAVLAATASWPARLARLAAVTAITAAPTAAWLLLEPGALESSHIRGDQRAGPAELWHSLREAGVTLARGDYLPAPVQAVVGVGLLAAPIASIVLTSRALTPQFAWRPRFRSYVVDRGFGPWLWFLVAYTPLVAIQRWSIDREIIARYWLPYWIVTTVVLGRCLVDWAAHVVPARGRTAQRMLLASSACLVLLAAYNVAQVAVTTRENARDGVTINALRYQRSEALDALAEQPPGTIHTDHVQLVELQTYARGALAPIERLSCHEEALDDLVAEVEDAAEPSAIAVVGRCRGDDAFVEALLARFEGARVVRDPAVGVVIVPEQESQAPH